MDIRDTYRVLCEAIGRVRSERRPLLVEAVTYRFRGHSMADPEQYRSKEEVAAWRERDPIPAFAETLVAEGVIAREEIEQLDAEALARVDAAVEFAERSPFPPAESLYEDIYVLDGAGRGWYSVETTEDRAEGAGADGAEAPDRSGIPQQLTSALAAGENGHEEEPPAQ
jgi:TPP-dependent pyruvate/acetoin dehydrogenase alpha subunit